MLNSKTNSKLDTVRKNALEDIQRTRAQHGADTRVDELISTISEARRSLENWNEQKTEALMQLDALSYDIRIMEEEKARFRSEKTKLEQEIENNARIYQSHVDTLTDQMQLLKMEKDELLQQLSTAEVETEHQKQEVNTQLAIQQRMASEHSEQQIQTEMKFEKAQVALKKQIAQLSDRVEELLAEKSDILTRAEHLQNELDGIRSHMMGVLRVTDNAPVHGNASEKESVNKNTDRSQRLQAVEFDSSGGNTVQEYLKKFGY